jgi:hypothetical protein
VKVKLAVGLALAGRIYEAGATVDFPDETAKLLVRAGSAELVKVSPVAVTGGGGGVDEAAASEGSALVGKSRRGK